MNSDKRDDLDTDLDVAHDQDTISGQPASDASDASDACDVPGDPDDPDDQDAPNAPGDNPPSLLALAALAVQPNDPDALLALLDDPDAPQREQAFTLYCHGFRSTAIAAALRVHPRTVQRWLRNMRELIAAESRTDRAAELQRAIESYRAVESAAWEAYEHERELERQVLSGQLDHIRRRVRHLGRPRSHPVTASTDANALDTTGDTGGDETLLEELDRPRIPSQGVRFLAVALNAQREVNRLQGLYDQLQRERPPVHIHVSRDKDAGDATTPSDTDNSGQLPSSPAEK